MKLFTILAFHKSGNKDVLQFIEVLVCVCVLFGKNVPVELEELM